MALYFKSKDGAEISEMLNTPNLQTSNTSLSYRQLNHWESEGILPKRTGGWRRFSLIEVVWLYVISDLRQQYGISHENIRKIKKSLQVESSKYDLFMPVLDVYMSEAVRRKQIYLFVFEDFSTLSLNENEAAELMKNKIPGHVIVLDINLILKRAMPKYEGVNRK